MAVFKLTYTWLDEISNPYIISQHFYNAVVIAKDYKAACKTLMNHIDYLDWVPMDGTISGGEINSKIPTVIEIGYLVEEKT